MKDFFNNLLSGHPFNVGDVGAGTITLAALLELLPHLSALLSIIWIGLRIYISVRDDLLKKEK